MGQILDDVGGKEEKVIQEIIELQRAYYFENINKDTERQKKLRDIIDRAVPLRGK